MTSFVGHFFSELERERALDGVGELIMLGIEKCKFKGESVLTK